MLNKPSKPSWRTSLIWLGLAIVAWFILKLLGSVLVPFVVAIILAYSLHPAVEKLHQGLNERLPRVFCVLLVELIFLCFAVAFLLLAVPIVTKELPLLQAKLPMLAERLNETLTPLLAALGIELRFDPASVKNLAKDYLITNSDWVWSQVLLSLKVGGGLLLGVVSFVALVPVVLFYFLLDWRRLIAKAQAWIPPGKLVSVRAFFSETDVLLGQYMRGQVLVMLCLAIYYSVTLSVWGLELALPIGVFTGLAVCIPYVGFGMGLLLAFVAGVLQFGLVGAFFMVAVIYGIGQVLEGFVLVPRLVGERIGLPPLAVIFALLAFGEIFGFIGVLVALPVSAVLSVAIRRLKAYYQNSELYTGAPQEVE